MAIFLVFSLFSLNISFSFFLLFLKRRRRKKAFLFSSFEEEKEGEREMEERKCFCPFGEKRDLQGHSISPKMYFGEEKPGNISRKAPKNRYKTAKSSPKIHFLGKLNAKNKFLGDFWEKKEGERK